jgi:hypothetical protein
MLPLKVPGTSNVPAVRLATSPVHVPVTVIVPDKLIVAPPVPTVVNVTPGLMDKLEPKRIAPPARVPLLLTVHVVEKLPESQSESIVENTKANVP